MQGQNDDDGSGAAQRRDLSETERAIRNETWWRRISFTLAVLFLLSLVDNGILASRSHVDALVYDRTASGLVETGLASHDNTPTTDDVKNAIATWIMAMRDIPSDPTMVDRNAQVILAMTQANSQAFKQFQVLFGVLANPKELSKRGYVRTVQLPVSVTADTSLTFHVVFTEVTTYRDGTPQTATWQGSVTLAQPPKIPTNPQVGLLNPAGIIIRDFDIPWTNPTL